MKKVAILSIILALTVISVASSVYSADYDYRRNISCSTIGDNLPFPLNVTINGDDQVIWTYCDGDGMQLKYNDQFDYNVSNSTHPIPFLVESGNGTGYDTANVFNASWDRVFLFGDASNTTHTPDYSGNNNDALGTNSPTWMKDKGLNDGAYNYTGTEYFNTTKITWYTVSACFKGVFNPSTNGIFRAMFDATEEQGNWRIIANGDTGGGIIQIYNGANSAKNTFTSGVELNDNAWHCMTGTINGSIINLYVDGKLNDSESGVSASGFSHGDDYPMIGRTGSGSGWDEFNGTIDFVYARTDVISQTEVEKQYKALTNTPGYGTLEEEEFIGTPAPDYFNGSGTPEDPYNITRCPQFYNISAQNNTAYYRIINDIDCVNMNVTGGFPSFGGILDGGNNTVSNFYLNESKNQATYNMGFFRSLESNAIIHNIILDNFTVVQRSVASNTGLLAGDAGTNDNIQLYEISIKNSYLKGWGHVHALIGNTNDGADGLIIKDNYMLNSFMLSNETDGFSSFAVNGLIETVYGTSVFNTSWSNAIVNSTNGGSSECIVGETSTGGTAANLIYDSNNCQYSDTNGYAVSDTDLKDPNNIIWENYSTDVWFFEYGYYPLFNWEAVNIPRPYIITPGINQSTTLDDFTLTFNVSDADDNNVSCSLYIDDILNQTNSTTFISTTTTFEVLDLSQGDHKYYIECSDDTQSRKSLTYEFNVDSVPPVLTSIFPNVSNTSTANYTFTFEGSFSDPHLDKVDVKLKYPNGSVLYQTDNSSWNIFINLTGKTIGQYYAEYFANDTYGNEEFENITIAVSDDILPICFGFDDSQVGYDSYLYQWDVDCLDERKFFSLNVTCSGGSNYNFSEVGINQTNYAFAGSTTITNDTVCDYEYCDGHTKQSLKEKWYIQKHNKSLKFKVKGKTNHIKTIDDSSITYKKKKDRINFNISFKKKYKDDGYKIMYHTSPNSYYYPDKIYKGWIVDYDSRTWFDLNEINGDSVVNVNPYNSTTWEITLTPKNPNKRDFSFNSVGELNCVQGSQNLTYVSAPPSIFAPASCPTTVSGAMILSLIVMIGLFLVTAGFASTRSVMGLFGSIMLMVSSWVLLACYMIAGYVLLMFSIFGIVYFVFRKV